MKIKKAYEALLLVVIISIALISCVIDTKTSLCIRNCTKDTLYLVLTEADKITDDDMYFSIKEENVVISHEDTSVVHVEGGNVILWMPYCTMPDSVSFFAPLFEVNDTCYIYAFKWHTVTRYPLEEIRKRNLYNRRTVTKKDFHNRLYEYKQ